MFFSPIYGILSRSDQNLIRLSAAAASSTRLSINPSHVRGGKMLSVRFFRLRRINLTTSVESVGFSVSTIRLVGSIRSGRRFCLTSKVGTQPDVVIVEQFGQYLSHVLQSSFGGRIAIDPANIRAQVDLIFFCQRHLLERQIIHPMSNTGKNTQTILTDVSLSTFIFLRAITMQSIMFRTA